MYAQRRVTAALIGAGSRGMDVYGSYALKHPKDIEFIAVADPNPKRRAKFKKLHNIKDEMVFTDWQSILDKPKLSDVIFICTQDKMHFEPSIKALEAGYHVLLEKPMATTPKECIAIGKAAEKSNSVFAIAHVLRYTPLMQKVKKLLDAGVIGNIVCIQHNENVGYWHQAHSFVRGNWRNSDETSPMILAKSCHDMDLLLWLAGSSCKSISSFGGLYHFKGENAPSGAPLRCIEGCPAETKCAFFAPRLYLTDDISWPTSVISSDMSYEGRYKALKEGPYGRCVYHCDNNVVDHQVVNIDFENGVTAAFTMCAFSEKISRTTKLMGTKGEMRVCPGEIEVTDFLTGTVNTIQIMAPEQGHEGGDEGMMRDFVHLIKEGGKDKALTSANTSVESHLMAFAAEKSRLENKVVNIKEYFSCLFS